MPRKPRIHFAGAIYHVMARGVDRRPIFVDDHDRKRFLDQMRRYERELGAQILAYCLMGNHFHLAVKVAASTLGAFMQRLTGGYAATFNHRHGRVGHLFESRYKDKLCLDDRYLLTLIHYIHMNPVRAGLVSVPGDWPWSSFKPMDGPFPDLDAFEPWDREDTAKDLKRTACALEHLDEIGDSIAVRAGTTIERLKSREIRDRAIVSARRQFVSAALLNGHTLAAAARWLRMTRSSVGRYALESTTQHREV
jgi:REP element-mobilizing transposase RayT